MSSFDRRQFLHASLGATLAAPVLAAPASTSPDLHLSSFRFDVTRPDNKQVAFGYGVHFCLGAHLARLELRVFFEELLKRVDDLQLAGEPSRSATVFVGGLKHLPVTYRIL